MNKEKWINILSIVLLFICFVMIAVGFNDGESEVVLAKARAICMECIGIG